MTVGGRQLASGKIVGFCESNERTRLEKLLLFGGPLHGTGRRRRERSGSHSAIERRLRNFIVMRHFLFEIGFPLRLIPQFEMILHSEQNHLAFESRQIDQFLRQPHATLAIERDSRRASVEQPAVIADLPGVGRSLSEPLGQASKSVLGVKRQRSVGAWSDVQPSFGRGGQTISERLGNGEPLLFVERTRVGARQKHFKITTEPHSSPLKPKFNQIGSHVNLIFPRKFRGNFLTLKH